LSDISPVSFANVLPQWNYDGSSTEQAAGRDSEVTLNPVYCVPCPFHRGRYTVLCQTLDREEKALDNYPWAKSVFDDARTKQEHPWYGLEQEYFIMDSAGVPLGLKKAVKQGQYYCSVGTGNAHGRIISDQHYQCCLDAGLEISGTNAEVAPGQWEFQIGPVEGLAAACQLQLARYFLVKLTENHDLRVSFHPKPKILRDDEKERGTKWNGSGCHANFSTALMRKKNMSGSNDPDGFCEPLEHIESAIRALSEKHDLHMMYYGEDNRLRMTGECETAAYDKFTSGRANRCASVRIPNEVIKNECGYFEDRRPAANCDPFLVTGLIAVTVLRLDDKLEALIRESATARPSGLRDPAQLRDSGTVLNNP
jgi:glutamine synthetase